MRPGKAETDRTACSRQSCGQRSGEEDTGHCTEDTEQSEYRAETFKAAQRPRRSIQSTGSSSVDNLLREVDNIETDVQTRHEELRREAWERTQRNVAKAKAEVERLELEREQNAREEARKLKVQQELERRQQMKEAEKRKSLLRKITRSLSRRRVMRKL